MIIIHKIFNAFKFYLPFFIYKFNFLKKKYIYILKLYNFD